MVDKKSDDIFDFNDDDFPDFDETDNDFQFEDEEDSDDQFSFSEETASPNETGNVESEEYHLEEETSPDYESPASHADNNASLIQRLKGDDPKRLVKIATISFLLFIILIYFIIRMVSGTPAASSDNISANSALVNQSAMPPVVTGPAPISAPAAPTITRLDDKSQHELVQALDENKNLQQQIQQLQAELEQANAKINTFLQQQSNNDSRLTNMEKAVNSVDTQINKVNTALQLLVAAASQATSPGGGHSYYIQAIIPGRAWLKDNSGQTITIAYGDEIPGYGNVTKIDPANGVVLTSSGIKITYGIENT